MPLQIPVLTSTFQQDGMMKGVQKSCDAVLRELYRRVWVDLG